MSKLFHQMLHVLLARAISRRCIVSNSSIKNDDHITILKFKVIKVAIYVQQETSMKDKMTFNTRVLNSNQEITVV